MNNTIYYLERTANATNQITLKTKLFERRIIYLDTEINRESVNSIIQQISLLCSENANEPITILINSPGGSIQDGLVLVDVMEACPCTIKTVSLGIAASMAAIILVAGTKGHRYISPSSQVMLHQPLIAGSLPGGNCSEIETIANSLIERKNQINNLLVKFTGESPETINELTSKDTYLIAKEALKYGLVDNIAENNELFKLIGGLM